MIIEDPEILRTWLTSYLEPLCEADPEALAKYVLALIKKDKAEEELKGICLDQLEVFLNKETQPFVNVFFQKLHDKSYIREVQNIKAKTPPVVQVATLPISTESTTSSQPLSVQVPPIIPQATDKELDSSLAEPHRRSHSQNGNNREPSSRKRSRSPSPPRSPRRDRKMARNDVDMRDRQPRPGQYPVDDRNRRDGQRGGAARRRPAGGHRRPDERRRSYSRSRSPSPYVRSRSRSKERRRSAGREKPRSQSPSNRRRERCRDFDESLSLSQNSQIPLLPTPNAGQPGNQNWTEPYNPEAPAIDRRPQLPPQPSGPVPSYQPDAPYPWGMVRAPLPQRGGPFHGQPQPNGPMMNRPRELSVITPSAHESEEPSHQHQRIVIDSGMSYRGRGGGGGRGRGFGGRGRGRGGGGYGKRPGMPHDQPDKCTLEVRKLPPNLNNISNLNEHFSKFGTIVNLQVKFDGDPEAALVQFTNHFEAKAAHQSTDAVLNNRFIKVFWHSKDKDNRDQPQESTVGADGQADNGQEESRRPVKERITPKLEEEPPKPRSIPVTDPSLLKMDNTKKEPTKSKGEQRKENALKKFELIKKRQELLIMYMTIQKDLLSKMDSSKSEAERTSIRNDILALNKKVNELEDQIKKDRLTVKAMASARGANKVLSATSAGNGPVQPLVTSVDSLNEKNVLDMDLEVYKNNRSDID
ncbi:RNA-binding protein 26 [Halotydeus destructor]|nr:RNA-binding protein 26 [Halotydeus destructor]